MQDAPLLVSGILRHGRDVYGDSTVQTVRPEGTETATFAHTVARAEQLAAALARLGVGRGDRVATFMWTDQEHLEIYLAVPAMGAVLHTLNLRLFPELLTYVINHAEDKVLIVDDTLVGLVARVLGNCPTVEHVIVVGDGDASVLGTPLSYEDLVRAETPGYSWPDLDEREAAAMCYTSGTTGDPKGVVYSHRSTWLHSFACLSANCVGVSEADRILVIVPMFHVNAWGMPYAAFLAGSSLILPERFLQAEPLARICRELRPTICPGVPTIWNDLLHYAQDHDVDLSSVRLVTAGGAAVSRGLMESYERRFGVKMIQGWGMTETSPVCALANPPPWAKPEDEMQWRAKTGRVIAGVEVRITDDADEVLPRDGQAVGEFEVRGPWITGSYYGNPAPERFHDGWLRTGDVGTIDPHGFMSITDRTKDVIKSGGEWISSVELENQVMEHPSVFEAAVVAVPDPRWTERPLVVVVPVPGTDPTPPELLEFLSTRVARLWLPERWALVTELPKTSVGKFDKKVLRARAQAGDLVVQEVALPGRDT